MESRPFAALIGLLVAGLGPPLPPAGAQSFLTQDGAFDCLIEPRVVVEVGSSVEGILAEVAVDRGDIVEAGQVVARLESEVELASVELARARAENDARIELRRESMEFEARKLERAASLSKSRVVSAAALDEARTNTKLANLQLDEAQLEKRIAELELDRSLAFLNQRTIRSPVDGVVLRRNEFVGEHVHEQTTVLEIAQMDPLNVEVFVPVELYGRIREGTRARVSPQEPIGGTYEAEVSVVDRVFDAASGTFGVRLSLANPNYALPAGIRCRVHFEMEPASAGEG